MAALAAIAAATGGAPPGAVPPGAAPPLTRRQAIGLSRRMSQTDLPRQGMASIGTGVMAPQPLLYGLPQAMQPANAAAAAVNMWPGGAGMAFPPAMATIPEVQQQQLQRQQQQSPSRQRTPAPSSPSPPPAVRLPKDSSSVLLSRWGQAFSKKKYYGIILFCEIAGNQRTRCARFFAASPG